MWLAHNSDSKTSLITHLQRFHCPGEHWSILTTQLYSSQAMHVTTTKDYKNTGYSKELLSAWACKESWPSSTQKTDKRPNSKPRLVSIPILSPDPFFLRTSLKEEPMMCAAQLHLVNTAVSPAPPENDNPMTQAPYPGSRSCWPKDTAHWVIGRG